MTRRSFLQSLLVVAAATMVPVSIAKILTPEPAPLTHEQMIAQAINTPEGRRALAQAMVEPIKTSLMYQSVGRRLLMVEKLPHSAFDWSRII